MNRIGLAGPTGLRSLLEHEAEKAADPQSARASRRDIALELMIRSIPSHERTGSPEPRPSFAPSTESGALGTRHPTKGRFAPVAPSSWASAQFELGGRYQADGSATFGLYSKNATAVLMEIYADPFDAEPVAEYWMTPAQDDEGRWQAHIEDAPEPMYYGFRLFGPNWPYSPGWRRGDSSAGFVTDVDQWGNRFNPNKLVIDPYGREMSHDRTSVPFLAAGLSGELYMSGSKEYRGRPSRELDTGAWAPKSVLFRDRAQDTGTKPAFPVQDEIIYESHVRGLTQHKSVTRLADILEGRAEFDGVENIPAELRGTYAGVAKLAPYLKGLGVNVLELLPVHEFDDEGNLIKRGEGSNAWGYMTDSFFAPNRRYAHDRSPGGPTREFKAMVKALHDAGIKVYLDVVYNHSGEGGHVDGEADRVTIAGLMGVDAASYFMRKQSDPTRLRDFSGTGNTIDPSSPVARQMILDSLRYWADDMGVDGFRFDLMSILGRRRDWGYAFDSNAPLFRDISALSKELNFEVVAEPWDIYGYHVGQFPEEFAEWNGQYRDIVRRYTKSDGNLYELIEAFSGSPHTYGWKGADKSINKLTAHDGFTMADLVSYRHKNNDQAWPFGASDGGANQNNAWDHAVPGWPQHRVEALRRQQIRNFWALHLLARGRPLILQGDEFGRTQNGNNNVYNLDTVAIQNNYAMIATDAPHRLPTGEDGGAYHDNLGEELDRDGQNSLFDFSRFMIGLRNKFRCLRSPDPMEVPIHWYGVKGKGIAGDRHASTALIDGTKLGEPRFAVMSNTYWEGVEFVPPRAAEGKRWVRIVDTASWAEEEGANAWVADEGQRIDSDYYVHPRALVILQEVDA